MAVHKTRPSTDHGQSRLVACIDEARAALVLARIEAADCPAIDARLAALLRELNSVAEDRGSSSSLASTSAAALLGAKGGASGTGASKRRAVDYAALGRKGGLAGKRKCAECLHRPHGGSTCNVGAYPDHCECRHRER